MVLLIIGGVLVATAAGLSIAVGKAQAGTSVDARVHMEPEQLAKLLMGQFFGIMFQEKSGKPPAEILANKIKLAKSAAKTAQMLGLVKTAAGLLAAAEAWKQGKSGSELDDLLALENWPGTDQTVLAFLVANTPPQLKKPTSSQEQQIRGW